jgi:23S rRNA C2498 (ribose-2'-O)-methylase RlmM
MPAQADENSTPLINLAHSTANLDANHRISNFCKSLLRQQSLRHALRRATSLYTREALKNATFHILQTFYCGNDPSVSLEADSSPFRGAMIVAFRNNIINNDEQ